MRIAIFGAGSLGCALGALLATENEVTLVGRRWNMVAVRQLGLKLLGDMRMTVHPEARTSVSGLIPPDLLLIATKAYDTAAAVDECKAAVSTYTRVLTLQNGLGNLEVLRRWKAEKAFGGTTTMGATMKAPGVVSLSGLGRTIIGSDMDPRGAREIALAFRKSGLPTSVERNIQGEIWAKASVNACINPMSAILKVPNGKLLESIYIRRLMLGTSRECEAVASACRVRLPCRSLFLRVVAVARDTSRNISSMLRDVQLGRRTEIDYINGAFCALGKGKGVPTPLNRALAAMVEALGTSAALQKG